MRSPDPDGSAPDRSRYQQPAASARTVLRSPVIQQLSAPTARVVVVTAPGGYGKTSHLAAWAAAEQRSTAWIDLDEAHNDVDSILAALTEALSDVTDLDVGVERLMVGGATPAQVTTLIAPTFARALARCGSPFVLVLDDLQVISHPSALDLLDSLVGNVPDGSTVVLAGRSANIRSLPRLRADGGFVEISVDDLRLGPVEARIVVDEMGIEMDDDHVDRLTVATEGWPVGIRLGALAMRAPKDGYDVVDGLDGRDHLISDYLSSEWLGGLRLVERDFLMRSSVLELLSAAVCNHMLGRSDSGDVLHRIYIDRHLVIPLDRRNESYRTHALLREALLAEFERLDSVGLREAHLKASEWFVTTGDIDRAVRHRLAAGDFDAAEQLIGTYALAYFANGRYATVSRWLESVPIEHIAKNGSLCLGAAMTSLGLGDEAGTATWLRFAERAIAAEPTGAPGPLRLQLLAFRSLMNTGAVVPALADAREAYKGLPPGHWHAAACVAYGVWLWSHGDEGADEILAEGAEEAVVWQAPSLEANCRAMLAMIAYSNGDYDRARSLSTVARQVLIDHGLEQAPAPVTVIATSALVEATSGDAKRARDDILLARRNLAYFHDTAAWANVQSRLMLARASLALGDHVSARVLVQEVHRYLESQPDAIRAHAQANEIDATLRAARASALSGPSSLSTAELRVLHYLPSNLSLAEIGNRLFISRFTAKTHCAAIYRKLSVRSRNEAVELARRVGLLPAAEASVPV